MRSRYTAYALLLEGYLIKTWHPSTRPLSLDIHLDPIKWIGLEIKNTATTGADSTTVEFIARYKVNGKAERLHEVSEFKLLDGCWYYLTGELK